jgi:uncharacterized protein (DUF1800 family)
MMHRASTRASRGIGGRFLSRLTAAAVLLFGAAFSIQAASSFYTVRPCRFDTRTLANGPAVAANTTRAFSLLDCGVPPTAAAVVLNVTVTQPSVAGNVALYPTGGAQPGTSSINYRAGQTRANNAIVPLAGGSFTVIARQTSGSVQVILDISGYFDNPTNNQPPVVTVGADQRITLPSATTVSGSAVDDGKPSGTLTYAWTKRTGPGTASFGTPTAASSSVSFDLPGPYVLRLTANDGGLTGFDELTVDVVPQAADLARFLEQATFGPNAALTAHVQAIGIGGYLAEQFSLPSSGWPVLPLQPTQVPPTCLASCQRDQYSMYPLQRQFFLNGMYGQDQIRQKTIWALHKLLVVSGLDVTLPSWMLPYIQTIDRNAFGNYRQLLYEMTLNPAMGFYLNMNTSTKNNPNENYAREILQLFSVGTELLNPDGTVQVDLSGDPVPTYDQPVVSDFAKIFTGWQLAPNVSNGVPDYITPMVKNANNHDTTSKTLLNKQIIPAGQTQDQDLNSAIDNIFNHPNLGPYLAKHLIHEFVTSNPTPAYVGRVAAAFNNDGYGVRGDMMATITAVLLDPEARGTPFDPNYGRLRDPAYFSLNLLRAFNAKGANLTGQSDGVINPTMVQMGLDVWRPPTVFSYYPADYLIPGSTTVLGPEFGLMDASKALKRANFVNTMVFSTIPVGTNNPGGTALDFAPLFALTNNPQAMVDYLNNLMMHGTMSIPMQSSIVTAINAVPSTSPVTRAQTAVYLVATSSQYQVQK